MSLLPDAMDTRTPQTSDMVQSLRKQICTGLMELIQRLHQGKIQRFQVTRDMAHQFHGLPEPLL
jgi:hypothetical protein